MKQIEFFFDYLSPFSYIAFERLRKRRHDFQGIEIVFTPVIMSQVIHAWGTLGPAEIAPKRDFLMRQCLKIADMENIDFKIPPSLPFNTLDALRLTMVPEWKERQFEFVTRCFHYAWQERGDLGDYDSFKVYMKNFNFDFAEANSKELRRLLKTNTKRAIEIKLFGVPTFMASKDNKKEKELFWGSDTLNDILDFFKGHRSQNFKSEYDRYLSLFADEKSL